ncbi:MAG: isocitrate/isopropylmalate dehydrogenase family protein [bacterium]|nr:isocitrate/isopropylmalate dehydrogenase family protein [bacterium]
MYKVAVIAGDGVGPEVMDQVLKVASVVNKQFNLDIRFDQFPYGADHYLTQGITIPESVFKEWPQEYSAILLGALGDPRVPDSAHAKDILLGLRFKLDLFVNFRPVRLLDTNLCPLKHITQKEQVDFVVFRENTEDIYAGAGGNLKKNTADEVAVENCLYTYKGVERIITAAFQYAETYGLKTVMMSDKSNAMRYVGDLWQRVFKEVGDRFEHINKEHMYIDALCMEVIRNPARLEVVVTSNMFGDIVTDVAAQVQGGMGVAASINYNAHDKKFLGLFEPVHGSAPDIAGSGKANPVAAVLSYFLLLQRLGYAEPAEALHRAVEYSLKEGVCTGDLGGTYSTAEVGDFICKHINN